MGFTVLFDGGYTQSFGGASYTCNTHESFIQADASGGAVSVTLPGAGLYPTWTVTVKKVDSSANTVTLLPPPGAVSGQLATIDGGPSLSFSTQNQAMSVTAVGRNFYSVQGYTPNGTYVPPQPGKTTAGAASPIPFYNALDYGIKADGVTDDGAAINTFLAAVGTKAAYFPYSAAGYLSSVEIDFSANGVLVTDHMILRTTITSGNAAKWGSGIEHRGYLEIDGTRTDNNCAKTTGSPTITDAAITAGDTGKTVTGTGIPAGTYVGTVTPGVSFLLSSSPTSQVNVNATATNSLAVVLGSIGAVTGLMFQQTVQVSLPDHIFVHGFDSVGSWGCQWTNDGSGGGHYYNKLSYLRFARNYQHMLMQTVSGNHAINDNEFLRISMNPGVMAGLVLQGADGNTIGAFECEGLTGRVDAGCGTTNANATVTDAAILAADINRAVTGAGIPAGTYITGVTPGVSFTMNNNATATSTVSLTIGGDAILCIGVQGLFINGGWLEGNPRHLTIIGTDATKVSGIYVHAVMDDTSKVAIPDTAGNRSVILRGSQFQSSWDRILYTSSFGLPVTKPDGTQTGVLQPNGVTFSRTGGISVIDQLGGASTDELGLRTKTGGSQVVKVRIRQPAGLALQLNETVTLSAGTGAPAVAGALGDIFIRSDGGVGSTLYRCTTAGAAGVAVWTAVL